MIQFETLLKAGARVAAMSGVEDGDCGLRASAQETRDAFMRRIGVDPCRVVSVSQVHGNRVLLAAEADAGRGVSGKQDALGEADGLITNVAGLPLCVSIADCVPVLLYSPAPGAVGALHSGRAGTLLNIVGEGVRAMRDAYGCAPSTMHAAMGPCISGPRYEVSEELGQAFRDAGYPAPGRHIDLAEVIALQLRACGLKPERITLPPACTYEDARFFSYRRGDSRERNTAVIML
ncbi:MAG: hypothetical protein RLZZ303_1852 [Candidatus Hydrogenedentota bacterium]|jgi:YfiH family protein